MLLVLAALFVAAVPAQQPTPNVVLILADDLGPSDLSSTGSDYHRTPNLDAIARYGMVARRAYSCGPNCAPTRAGLWSGRAAPRTGVYTVTPSNRGHSQFRQLIAPETATSLPAGTVTLAQTMQSAGYATALVGKWHLGSLGAGFDHAVGYGVGGSVATHFAGPDGAFPLPGLGANGRGGQFLADRLTDEAMSWVAARGGPFFLTLSHYSPHAPIEAPAADIAAFDGVPKGVRHSNQTYAAMLKNLDDNIGRLVCQLAMTADPQRPGSTLISNTVVIFASDNGGVKGVTDNHPHRGHKGQLYNGGIRVPLIVLWYQTVAPGATLDEPITTLDLFPTIARIAGATPPPLLDGRDFLATIPQRALFWHFPAYLEDDPDAGTWRTTPVSAIARGPWKLLYYYETRMFELFNVDDETQEVSDTNYQVVVELCDELREWLIDTEAAMPRDKDTGEQVPYPNASLKKGRTK